MSLQHKVLHLYNIWIFSECRFITRRFTGIFSKKPDLSSRLYIININHMMTISVLLETWFVLSKTCILQGSGRTRTNEDLDFLYDKLCVNCFPHFPENSHDFEPGFSFTQIYQACQFLKINAFIYEWNVDVDRKKGKAAGLRWRSSQVEGNLRLNMVMSNRHLIYIKKLKSLFNQFQCLKCKCCYRDRSHFERHEKIYE